KSSKARSRKQSSRTPSFSKGVEHPRQKNQRSDWTSVNAKFSILANYQHADRRFCALNRNTTIILGSPSRQANQSAVDRSGVVANVSPLSIPLRLFEWRFVTQHGCRGAIVELMQ